MTSVDGVIIGESEGKILAVNKGVEKIFGCSGDKLVGKLTFRNGVPMMEVSQISGRELMEQIVSAKTLFLE